MRTAWHTTSGGLRLVLAALFGFVGGAVLFPRPAKGGEPGER